MRVKREVPLLQRVIGFRIEIHHGSDGADAMDAEASSLDTIRKAITQDGVTSFCPTTMTMDKNHILSALKVIHNAIKADERDGARILGAHLEGPFISPTFKGAQKEEDIRPCDVSLMVLLAQTHEFLLGFSLSKIRYPCKSQTKWEKMC